MSSNQPKYAALARGLRARLAGWSLRRRLLAGILALFALAFVIIGAVSTVAMRQVLVHQVDGQLSQTNRRAGGGGFPPPNTGGPPFGGQRTPNFLGQPPGTINATIRYGQFTQANVLDPDSVTSQRALTDEQRTELSSVPADSHPHTVSLPGLGTYRVVASTVPDGDAVVMTGLPLTDVQDAVWRLLAIEGLVAVGGLLIVGFGGATIVRLSLRPLRRVAATASRVAELPLARGEVDLSVRVPDADPRTEVGQVGAAINRMLGHVGDALAIRHASETRVRQFVADASHELRTPLAAIRGYAELTRRGRDEVPPDLAHAMGRVESESARMTTLVDDLLLLARLDSGRPLDREPVELSALVVDTVNDAHAAGRDHRWLLDLPDRPVTVPGDAARLHQVLANLLANARTHTPAGTTVVTTLTTTTHGCALVSVTDDGPGIPEPLQAEVFERFARGDSSRSRAAGSTGLGLSIVAAVVEAHGGRVSVRSRPGQTTFTVALTGAVQGDPDPDPETDPGVDPDLGADPDLGPDPG
jgi:two-component system OmpR family sensor kinase